MLFLSSNNFIYIIIKYFQKNLYLQYKYVSQHNICYNIKNLEYESSRKSIYYVIFYRKSFQINNNNLLKNYNILKILCNIIILINYIYIK